MILERDSHNLLYDTSYDWISIVASRTQRELASLATGLTSKAIWHGVKTAAKGDGLQNLAPLCRLSNTRSKADKKALLNSWRLSVNLLKDSLASFLA
jgi:hypothetical protein